MDARFAAIHNDPRFARKRSKDKHKATVEKDDRFAALDTDKDFSVIGDASTDKYGRRKISKKKQEKKVSTHSAQQDDDAASSRGNDSRSGDSGGASNDNGNSTLPTQHIDTQKKKKKKTRKRGHEDAEDRMERLNRLARGEAFDSDYSSNSSGSDSDDKYVDVGSSGSSDGGSSDFSDNDKDDFESTQGDSDIEVPEGAEKIYNENLRKHEAVLTGEETKRLAVVNLDWDRVRAVDLHSLLQSFLSGVGTVRRVTIYPSDFGLKMMKQDEQFGPQGIYADDSINSITDSGNGNDDDDDDGDNNNDEDATTHEDDTHEAHNDESTGTGTIDDEKLRQYEMQKLRYYFGVIECNSVETATSLYNQCDGLEYESSSLVLDLRYIPDDIQFMQLPRTTSTHIPETYKPPEYFYSHALQQTNVKLTWDEPEVERKALSSWSNNTNTADKGAYAEQDLRTYLAEASEESELDEERWSSANDNDDADNDEQWDDAADEEASKKNQKKKKSKKSKKSKKDKKDKKSRKKAKKDRKKKLKSKYLATFGMDVDDVDSEHEIGEEEGNDDDKRITGLIPDDEYEGLEIKFNAGFGENDGDAELAKKFGKKKSKNDDLSVFARYQQEKKMRRKERRALKKKERDGSAGGDNDTDLGKPDDSTDDFFLGWNASGTTTNKESQDVEDAEREERAKAELNLLMIPETYGDERDRGINAGSNDMTYKKMVQQEKQQGKKRKGKKRGKKNQQEVETFEVNTSDNRFSAIFDDSSYAIDPTDSRYVSTNNMKKYMNERQSRRRAEITRGELNGAKSSGVVTVDANRAQRDRKPQVPETMLQKNATESLVETLKRKHAEMKKKKGGNGGTKSSGNKKRRSR